MTLSPRWRKVLSDLAAHKFRTLLVVLSIAVGVFAIAIVMGGRGVLTREFEQDFASSNVADAAYDTSGFDDSLVRSVLQEPTVALAEARRRVPLRFTGDEAPSESAAGWDAMTAWALPSFDRIEVQRLSKEEGTVWPPGPGEIVIERSAQQAGEYEIGQTLTVETSAGERATLRIVGFVHDINAFPTKFSGTLTGYVSMDSLAELDAPAEYNHLMVVFAEQDLTRAQASRLAADLRDDVITPAGTQVYRTDVPEPGSHFLGDIFKAVSLLLLALGVLSLGLSAFLVVNTISAIMTQQVGQVGIMKAVGGRSRQIMSMYLTLVTAYGLLAILIGLPVGWIAGRWFIEYAAGLLNFSISSYVPPAYVIGLEIAVGLLVPILAAIVPVRLGSRITVVKALHAGSQIGVTFGEGLIDRALGFIRGLPRPVALSLRNTFLRKGRLALTLATLILASAMVMAVLSVRTSIVRTVDDIGEWWNYDAQATFSQPRPSTEVEAVGEQVSGVTDVETWLEQPAALQRDDGSENESIYAIGLPPDTRFITPKLVAGRWLEATDTDAVVVNTDVAKDEATAKVGSEVRLKIRGDERPYKVVGVVSGQLMGPVIFIDRDYLDSVAQTAGGVTRLLVMTEGHAQEQQETAAAELEQRLADADLSPRDSDTQVGMRERLSSQLGILVTFLVIMAGLLAIVGVIGLTGTMTINVLESTREIGVMRAIGASHRSIFGIFITEAVVIAVIAWILGAVLSWPVSYLLTRALALAMNLPLSYEFSFPGIGIWLGSVLVIAVVASVVPAWRASQVSVRDAIAYE